MQKSQLRRETKALCQWPAADIDPIDQCQQLENTSFRKRGRDLVHYFFRATICFRKQS